MKGTTLLSDHAKAAKAGTPQWSNVEQGADQYRYFDNFSNANCNVVKSFSLFRRGSALLLHL